MADSTDSDEKRSTRAITDVDIDQLLGWVAQRDFADERIGAAMRRIAQVGTLEQFITFTSTLRASLRSPQQRHVRRRRINLLAMNPIEFEHLMRQLFDAMGFDSWDTHFRPDDGVDAVAYRRDPVLGGESLIQVKRYKNLVPVETVRALAGAVHARNAAKGIIVTTSWFGDASRDFAQRTGDIELIDGRELRTLLHRHLGLEAYIDLPEFPTPERR
jgi:HJR/Mrr/RecB family endonuclease